MRLMLSVMAVLGMAFPFVAAGGSLLETAPAVVAGQVATSEVTRSLLVDSFDLPAEERWTRAGLEAFVAELDTEASDLVTFEVAHDYTGHAIGLEYGPAEQRRHVCVVAGEDGLPTSQARPCGPVPAEPADAGGGDGG